MPISRMPRLTGRGCQIWRVASLSLLFLAVLHSATVTPASACYWASRLRRFPLGVAGGDVIIAESKERRGTWMTSSHLSSSNLEASLYWIGELELRRFTPGKGFTGAPITLGEYTATVSYYYRDMRRVLQAALRRARQLAGFQVFARPQMWRCSGATRCGDWTVSEPGRVGLLVAFRGSRIVLDAKDKERLHESMESHPSGLGSDQASKGFGPVLRYSLGSLQVDVASISSGFTQLLGGPFGWHDRRCRGVTTCVPPANLVSHQASIDVLRVAKVQPPAPPPHSGSRRAP